MAVFFDCDGLTTVMIPSSVTCIYRYGNVFRGCAGLQRIVVDEDNPNYKSVDGLLMSKDGKTLHAGVNGSVVIPSGVTSVGWESFEALVGLTNVTLPSSVTSVGYSAFYMCDGLTSIELPMGVADIGSYAFCHCSKMTSVTIPPSVASIGYYAFYNCGKLVTVHVGIGDSQRVSDMLVASGLKNAANLNFVEEYLVVAHNVTFNLGEHMTRTGGGELSQVVTNGCAAIAPEVTAELGWRFDGWSCDFSCVTNDLTVSALCSPVVLADGIYTQTVDGVAWTFSVSGGNASVTRASPAAGDVIIPSTLGGCMVTQIGDGVFWGCSRITSVSIPSCVTGIGRHAFECCSGLTSVTIPEGVTNICGSAFAFCSKVTNVTLSASVACIEQYAFGSCGNLSFVVAGDNATYKSSHGILLSKDGTVLLCGKNGNVVIPDGVEQIDEYAFCNCSGLLSVSIPSSVTNIGHSAFWGCSGLGNGIIVVDECVLTVNGECPSEVAIPDGTRLVAGGAFDNCSGLTSLTIPKSVKNIGDLAFYGCRDLVRVVIDSGVIRIGNQAFYECSGLTDVEIPPGVICIGDYAFSGCSMLARVTIPSSVQNFGSFVFRDCSKLMNMTVPGRKWGISFASVTNLIVSEGTTCIDIGAFDGCRKLECVTIPSSVTNIGSLAFYDCSGLTNVTIPASVMIIGSHAFEDCSGLSDVAFEGNAPAIGSSVFSGVDPSCTVKVHRRSTGWGVAIPGTWCGLPIQYGWGQYDDSLAVEADKTNGSTFCFSTNLTLTAKARSRIYYTLDGTDANENSAVYTSPITIDRTTTVKYMAVDLESDNWGPVGSVTLTRIPGESAAIVVTPSVADGTILSPGQTLVLAAGEGETIWYTVDGSDPRTSATRLSYAAPISFTTNTTLKYYAVNDEGDYSAIETASYVLNVADGGPYEQVLEDRTWSFTVSKGKATVTGATPATGDVVIPSELGGHPVTTIGKSAFCRNSELTSVTVPEGITEITIYAFKDCVGLTNVSISASVAHIGRMAFTGCSGLERGVVIVDGCVLTVNGECPTTVSLPQGTRMIAASAFSDCSGLVDITIPTGLTSICECAFENCSSLTNVVIPSGVASIGYHAFSECSALSVVSIPQTVTDMEWDVFYCCESLRTVYVDNADEVDRVRGLYTWPSAVTILVRADFVERQVNFDLGEHLTRTGGGELSQVVTNGCAAIAPDVTAELGWRFDGWSCDFSCVTNDLTVSAICSQATLANGMYTQMVDGVAWTFRVSNGKATLGRGRLFGERAVPWTTKGAIEIPSTLGGCPVTEIGDGAFYNCQGLTSVTIPDNVTYIGDYAFDSCSGLTSVSISASVTSISCTAFMDCTGLTRFIVDEDNSAYKSVNGLLLSKDGKTLVVGVNGNVEIPAGVTRIENFAFLRYRGLTSVTMPSSVTSIGDSAFSGCSGLTSLELPSRVTNISSCAFSSCSGLKDVTIPLGVASIRSFVFSGCSGLTNLTMHANVTNIGGSAFSRCSKLTSVTIPNGVMSIGSHAFESCSSLSSVMIPSNVTSIGGGAFSNCRGLTNVTIQAGVSSIGAEAFSGCSGLTGVTIPASVTNIGEGAFPCCGFVVDDDNPNYKSVDGLLLTKDGKTLVAGVKGEVAIPSGVTCIGSSAFSGCSGLTGITIPTSVTNIGSYAFSGCTGLGAGVVVANGCVLCVNGSCPSTVSLPRGTRLIAANAFMWCSELTSVIMPSGMTSIGESAFMWCGALTSMTIPSSVTHIGDNAFSWCEDLQTIYVEVDDVARVKKLLARAGADVSTLTFVEMRDENLDVSPECLTNGLVGVDYTVALTAEGGTAPYSWRVGTSQRDDDVLQGDDDIVDYAEGQSTNTFAEVGVAKGWQSDDSCWSCELPFEFPFYGKTYTRAYVGSNGTIAFDYAFASCSENLSELQNRRMIAVLWEDLKTTPGDVYVSTADDSITFRWSGSYFSGSSVVNFSATLYADGTVRLSYGSGNANGGLVGISAGNGVNYCVSACSQRGSLSYAPDVIFKAQETYLNYGLPVGMSLSEDGVLSGTPSRVSSNVFSVIVTDADGAQNSRQYVLVVDQHMLDVVVDLGNGVVTTNAVAWGKKLSFTAPDDIVDECCRTQYVCRGTSYTAPIVTNAFSICVTNDVVLSWNIWETNYWLAVDKPVNGRITDVRQGLYAAGSSVVLEATPYKHWHLAGWTGDTEGCIASNNFLIVTMDRSRTIGAQFALNGDEITWYVDGMNGSDVQDGRSLGTAFASIQKAIDSADSGDVVAVAAGRYEPIAITNGAVDVVSMEGSGKTIIDASLDWGNGISNRCATLGTDRGSVTNLLQGFTLCNGRARYGAGAYYGQLVDCVVSNNVAGYKTSGINGGYGGGAYKSILHYCEVVKNSAIGFVGYGGGGYECHFEDCSISGNSVSYYAGAAYYCTLIRCRVSGNASGYYECVWACTVDNSTLIETSASGTFENSIIDGGSASGTINNCILTDASGGGTLVNCLVQGGYVSGTANNCILKDTEISATLRACCIDDSNVSGIDMVYSDPGFVDAENGDYRLRSDSPCRDAGITALSRNAGLDMDMAGNLRYMGKSVDIGPIEYDDEPMNFNRPAQSLYIDAENGDDANTGSESAAMQTIQRAINDSLDGDRIIVRPGVYESIDTFGLNLEIVSVGGAASTVIDGGGAKRCVTFGEGTNGCLVGFTLRNGCVGYGQAEYETGLFGGGCMGGTLIRCVLTNNTATIGGGAYRSALVDCVLQNNVASFSDDANCPEPYVRERDSDANERYVYYGSGGGACDCRLSRCRVQSNRATHSGGGAVGGSLENCVVWRNAAVEQGGGVCDAEVVNCTVYGNEAVRLGGGLTQCEVKNTIAWANVAANNTALPYGNVWQSATIYSCSYPREGGEGNIDLCPLFVDGVNGDFRLSANSPCLNVGVPDDVSSVDFVGNPRQVGIVDMGAYEMPGDNALFATNYTVTLQLGEQGTFDQNESAEISVSVPNGGRVDVPGYAHDNDWCVTGWDADIFCVNSNMTACAKWVQLDSLPSATGDYYVNAEHGDDHNSGTSWAEAFASLKMAAAVVPDGSEIVVADGVYGPIDMTLRSDEPYLKFRSVNGAKHTTIDASVDWSRGVTNACAVFCDNGGEIDGFLVKNGKNARAGGISYGTVRNCIFTNNTDGWGSAYRATMYNCLFYGGASRVAFLCNMFNCTIVNCPSSDYARQSTLRNCILYGNAQGAGAYCYDCFTDDASMTGTRISYGDPCFVDPANGDYRLRANSPCIDAGANSYAKGATDLDGNARISNGTIDIGAYEYQVRYLAPPALNKASGTTFDETLTISMTCTNGASIYYTLDGSEPTVASTKYTKKFRITGKTTVKAIAAWDDDGWCSEVVTAEYALGRCADPVFARVDGSTFVSNQFVTIGWTESEGTLYYTLDGSEPTTNSFAYASPFAIDGNVTVKAKVFSETFFDSNVVSARYTRVWLPVAEPVITAETPFTRRTTPVEISCATPGAAIYYTLDGSAPTAASSAYRGAFTVSDSCTVRALAVLSNEVYRGSAEASLAIVRTWTIGYALGAPDLTFATSVGEEIGDAEWVCDTEVSHDGSESMRSGAITDNQQSILSTTVEGAGTLSFWVKTSCEDSEGYFDYDHLEFHADDEVWYFDGEHDWTNVVCHLEGEGAHTLQWIYVKDDEGFVGGDCVRLDDVSWTADPEQSNEPIASSHGGLEVVKDDGGWTVVSTNGTVLTVEEITNNVQITTRMLDNTEVDTTKGYKVTFSDDGRTAVLTLKTPELATPEDVKKEKTEDDPSGVLVEVPEISIVAKPLPTADERVGALPAKTVKGLWYQAAWGNDLNNLTQGVKVQATGDNLYLGVIKQTGNCGFYRISVSEK